MSNFKKEYYNPIELIERFWPEANVDHIIYDPKLKKGDFNIIKQSGGDGTLLFTLQMLQNGLIDIVNAKIGSTSNKPKDWSKVKSIKYTVGKMRHATVYGMTKLRCSETRKYPGLRERITMPVKCEYIYK